MHFLKHILFFLLLCAGYCASAQDKNTAGKVVLPKGISDTEAATYYYLEGIRALNVENNPSRAYTLFRSAVQSDSLHAPSLFEIGRILSIDPSGLPFIRKAVRLEPDNMWYKYQLAENYLQLNMLDSALAVCKEIIRFEPENIDAYKTIAIIYDIQNSPFAAISLLDSIELKFGTNPAVSEYKKELLIKTRMYDRAIDENLMLVENAPHNDNYLRSLAELYALKGNDSLAVNAYERALRIDSTNVATLMSMSDFYLDRNYMPGFLSIVNRIFKSDIVPAEMKVRYFNEVIKKDQIYRENYLQVDQVAQVLAIKHPDNLEVVKFYAEHLIYSGRLDEALTMYKAHASEATTDLEIFTQILGIEGYLQHPDSVLHYSRIALKAFPKNVDLYTTRAGAYYSMDMYPEAVKVMKESLKFAKTDSIKGFINGFIGDIYYQSGNRKKAFQHYEKALKFDPDNIMVLNNYSYYLSELEMNLEKALAMSARVVEQETSNSTYLDTYAWILYKLGRYEQAKEVMRKAVALDSTNSDVLLLHYGDILYELKEYFQASIYWKRALEKGYDPEEIQQRMEKIENK